MTRSAAGCAAKRSAAANKGMPKPVKSSLTAKGLQASRGAVSASQTDNTALAESRLEDAGADGVNAQAAKRKHMRELGGLGSNGFQLAYVPRRAAASATAAMSAAAESAHSPRSAQRKPSAQVPVQQPAAVESVEHAKRKRATGPERQPSHVAARQNSAKAEPKRRKLDPQRLPGSEVEAATTPASNSDSEKAPVAHTTTAVLRVPEASAAGGDVLPLEVLLPSPVGRRTRHTQCAQTPTRAPVQPSPVPDVFADLPAAAEVLATEDAAPPAAKRKHRSAAARLLDALSPADAGEAGHATAGGRQTRRALAAASSSSGGTLQPPSSATDVPVVPKLPASRVRGTRGGAGLTPATTRETMAGVEAALQHGKSKPLHSHVDAAAVSAHDVPRGKRQRVAAQHHHVPPNGGSDEGIRRYFRRRDPSEVVASMPSQPLASPAVEGPMSPAEQPSLLAQSPTRVVQPRSSRAAMAAASAAAAVAAAAAMAEAKAEAAAPVMPLPPSQPQQLGRGARQHKPRQIYSPSKTDPSPATAAAIEALADAVMKRSSRRLLSPVDNPAPVRPTGHAAAATGQSAEATVPDRRTRGRAAPSVGVQADGPAADKPPASSSDAARDSAVQPDVSVPADADTMAAGPPPNPLVVSIAEALNLAPGAHVGLRQVMTSGLLESQPLQFCDRQKRTRLTGWVTEGGLIACLCAHCAERGVQHSSSEWEAHAGSKERRPAEAIHLTDHGMTLRELCVAVQEYLQAHMAPLQGAPAGHCSSCGRPVQSGLQCRGCASAARAMHSRELTFNAGSGRSGGGGRSTGRGRGLRARGGRGIGGRGGSGGRARARPSTGALFDGAPSEEEEDSDPTFCGDEPPPRAKVHMAHPVARALTAARSSRGNHRNKRLFMDTEGALQHGERLEYRVAGGAVLLGGTVHIDSAGGASGILCDCCSTVISASQFEAHAGMGSRRAPYNSIFTEEGLSLRRRGEMMPATEEELLQPPAAPQQASQGPSGVRPRSSVAAAAGSLRGIAGRCEEVLAGLEEVGGGCALCGCPDFTRGAFSERTMLLCDQCEREFHVGCLRDAGRGEVLGDTLPQGDWFCSAACCAIHEQLSAAVADGIQPLGPLHTWQLIRGRDGSHATTWALKAAKDILTESFDPILDGITGRDLLDLMVYAQGAPPWDYTGMHTAVLRHRGKPVAVALMRVFGTQLAELPLVATRATARRQGHARVLVAACQNMLASIGVKTLSLPAASSTVNTWIKGFGFEMMGEAALHMARTSLRILIFPGSSILCKPLAAVDPLEAAVRAVLNSVVDSVVRAIEGPPPQERRAEAVAVARAVASRCSVIIRALGLPLPPPPPPLRPTAPGGPAASDDDEATAVVAGLISSVVAALEAPPPAVTEEALPAVTEGVFPAETEGLAAAASAETSELKGLPELTTAAAAACGQASDDSAGEDTTNTKSPADAGEPARDGMPMGFKLAVKAEQPLPVQLNPSAPPTSPRTRSGRGAPAEGTAAADTSAMQPGAWKVGGGPGVRPGPQDASPQPASSASFATAPEGPPSDAPHPTDPALCHHEGQSSLKTSPLSKSRTGGSTIPNHI